MNIRGWEAACKARRAAITNSHAVCLCYQKFYLANKIYIEQQQNYTNQRPRFFSQGTLPISLREDHTDECREELNSEVSQQQK